MAKLPVPKKPPNPAAKALADAAHRLKVAKAKKGKGSYSRKKPPARPDEDAPPE